MGDGSCEAPINLVAIGAAEALLSICPHSRYVYRRCAGIDLHVIFLELATDRCHRDTRKPLLFCRDIHTIELIVSLHDLEAPVVDARDLRPVTRQEINFYRMGG